MPGQAKTRMIPLLGNAGAADLQRQMTEHLLNRLHTLPELTLQIHITGGSLQQMSSWLGDDIALVSQSQGGLGDRLSAALCQGFASGLRHILVIGSDCPDLGEAEITQAIAHLQTHDVVLGPATDGGYYLLGLNQLHTALFEGIPWGSDRVLSSTQAIAHQQNLSVALLNPLPDIDRPEDIHLWDKARARSVAEKHH